MFSSCFLVYCLLWRVWKENVGVGVCRTHCWVLKQHRGVLFWWGRLSLYQPVFCAGVWWRVWAVFWLLFVNCIVDASILSLWPS
jgi:hypothetical protein